MAIPCLANKQPINISVLYVCIQYCTYIYTVFTISSNDMVVIL